MFLTSEHGPVSTPLLTPFWGTPFRCSFWGLFWTPLLTPFGTTSWGPYPRARRGSRWICLQRGARTWSHLDPFLDPFLGPLLDPISGKTPFLTQNPGFLTHFRMTRFRGPKSNIQISRSEYQKQDNKITMPPLRQQDHNSISHAVRA